MIIDTNVLIFHIRDSKPLPQQTIIPTVVAGELSSIAIQNGWGVNRTNFLSLIFDTYPLVDSSSSLIAVYATIDAYSQGKLPGYPLGMTPRNMGKNDLWIATIAISLGEELHTSDNDFNHLSAFGLRIVHYDAINPFGKPAE